MNSKLNSCPVCSEKFDLEARIPMCLPECGHTLCKLCCAKIAARFVQRCPLDKKWLRDTPKINNYALMNLQSIQEYHKDHEPCLQHKEKLKLLCLTDNVRICVDCHCIGEHQGHKIVHLGNIKQKLTKKKKMLEKSLENLDKHSTCMQNELKEAQNDVKGIVEGFLKKRGSKFQQLRKGTLEGLKASFDKEKKRIEGIFGKDSQFSAFLKKKIQDCSESDMNNPNLMQIVDEDMDQLLKRCDSTHFKESIEEYTNELNTVKDQMKQTVVKGKDQKLDFESLIKEFSLKQLAKQNDFGDFSGLVQLNSDV